MIYDYKIMENEQINLAKSQRFFRLEKNRLKPRYFIYTPYPITNSESLDVHTLYRFCYADFIARYERLNGKNVLFSVGYNNLDSSVLTESIKQGRPIYGQMQNNYQIFQKQLRMFDIGFDEEKEICLSDEEYVGFVQNFFQKLLENDLITYENQKVLCLDRIFQSFEYQITEEKEKLLEKNAKMLQRKVVCVQLEKYKDLLIEEVNNLKISENRREHILTKLGYQQGLSIDFPMSNGNYLTIRFAQVEYLCGISFVALNPNLVDIEPYLDDSEKEFLLESLNKLTSEEGLFTGLILTNVINGNDIPLFISTHFEEAVHVGIPSISVTDEMFASRLDLPYYPIFDYVDSEKILVNSSYLNGYSPEEAHQMIVNRLLKEGRAQAFDDLCFDHIIISSLERFGIPIPLKLDKSMIPLPVVYDIKHDVKMSHGEVVDKFVIKDFFSDEFTKALIINAIRLKNDCGIYDCNAIEALCVAEEYPMIDFAVLDEPSYEDDLIWLSIFNILFKKLWSNKLGYCFNFVEPLTNVLDANGKIIRRENNNIVDLNELRNAYGSTILRAYLAYRFNPAKELVFASSDLETTKSVVENIIRVFNYPLDDKCQELNNDYYRLLNDCQLAMKTFNINGYFKSLLNFIKKVHEMKRLSRTQGRGLLIVIYVIMPSLAEQIKTDVLNTKEPLAYMSWPE